MVRFIKISEWISPAEEAAVSRSEPMKTGKGTLLAKSMGETGRGHDIGIGFLSHGRLLK